MAEFDGFQTWGDGDRDSIILTAAADSEGLAISYAGGLAATGADFIAGVTLHADASGVRTPLVKSGRPAKLRITTGQVIAVGDRLGIGATAGQFSKVANDAGTPYLAIARGTTTGSGVEYVAADLEYRGTIEPAP